MFHRAGLVSLFLFLVCVCVVVAVPLPSDGLENFNNIYGRGLELVPYGFDESDDELLYVRETEFDDYTLFERDYISDYPREDLERRGLFSGIGKAFKSVGRAVGGVVRKVASGVKKVASGIKRGVGKVVSSVKRVASAVKKGVTGAISAVKQGVRKFGSAVKDGVKWVQKYGPTIAKVGLKALATGGSFTSRIAKFIPGFGIPLAGALKAGGELANTASNAIPAKLSGALGRTMGVLDMINKPKLPGALGAVASFL